MKQKYYVHMGPKGAEEVPRCWKIAHLLLFLALFGVSVAASLYIYSLLDSFNYNCILYGKLIFKKSGNHSLKINSTTQATSTTTEIFKKSGSHSLKINSITQATSTTTEIFKKSVNHSLKINSITQATSTTTEIKDNKIIDDVKDHNSEPNNKVKDTTEKKTAESNEDDYLEFDYLKNFQAEENRRKFQEYPEGWIAERSSAFATNHMCNLMLFPLITTTILALMLLVWVCLSTRGGRGVVGDLMPYPWLSVYPIIVLSSIMLIFSFISDRLFRRGCHVFCLNYKQFTNSSQCSEKIDKYTAQFNNGNPRPWYTYYYYSYIFVKTHTVLWACQLFLYVLRVLCLTDFNIYITRIRPRLDIGAKGAHRLSGKDMTMANIFLRAMQSKKKQKVKEERKKKNKEEDQKTV